MEEFFTNEQLKHLKEEVREADKIHGKSIESNVVITNFMFDLTDDVELKRKYMWEIYNTIHDDGYQNFGRYIMVLWLFEKINAQENDYKLLNKYYKIYLHLNYPSIFKRYKQRNNKAPWYWWAMLISSFLCSSIITYIYS